MTIAVTHREIDAAGYHRVFVGDDLLMLKFNHDPTQAEIEEAWFAAQPPEPPEIIAEDGTVL